MFIRIILVDAGVCQYRVGEGVARRDKSEFEGCGSHIDFAPHSNGAWLPLEGELADARYERLTEEVCGEVWVRR